METANDHTKTLRKQRTIQTRGMLRASERLAGKESLSRAIKDSGYSLNDLQANIGSAIADIEMLCKPADGAEKYWSTPWVTDIVAPKHEEGEKWTAIVYGANGKLYAVTFTVAKGEISLTGDPVEVEKTTDYAYVDELTKDKPEAKAEPKTDKARARGRKPLYRYAEASAIEGEENTVQVAFSSEYPVQRTATASDERMGVGVKKGETYMEVLSHDEGDSDFAMLNDRGAFLDEHDTAQQIGSIRKAKLSKDKMARSVLTFDEASELSKTRKKQIRAGSRPHISVGYVHTKFLGDTTLGDGTTGKRFAWSAFEISSVAVPADPKVGKGRAVEMEDEPDSMAHCLGCGKEFLRSQLDTDYTCDDCAGEVRHKTAAPANAFDSNNKERNNSMADTVVTITESEALTRSQKAATDAASARETDMLARNKQVGDVVDAYIKDHGRKVTKTESCESNLRKIANEFCQRDSKTPTPQLMLELGNRCLAEVAKFPNQRSFTLADDVDSEIASKYSLRAALKSCITRKAQQPEGFELDIHQQMLTELRSTNSQVPVDASGFMVPENARTPNIRSRYDRHADSDRFTRDLSAGVFGGAGALVPTQLMVPIIQLLRNRPVLTWAGVTMLGGLTGNVVIPRQTGACAPQALAEIAILNATQQTFDQITLTPKRVGNQQFYSRLLVIQSSPDVEALIREDNFRQIALLIDEYGLNGQGAGSQPLGIMNTPGINSVTFGGIVTLANAILMKTKIRTANVNDPLSYVTTSSSAGKLMSAPAQLIGSTVVSGSSNAIWTGNELEGQVVGTRSFASQQVPNDQMICGAFEHCVWASWAGLNVVIDYITRANQDEIGITMNTYNDVALRHPQAFTVSTDAANQG